LSCTPTPTLCAAHALRRGESATWTSSRCGFPHFVLLWAKALRREAILQGVPPRGRRRGTVSAGLPPRGRQGASTSTPPLLTRDRHPGGASRLVSAWRSSNAIFPQGAGFNINVRTKGLTSQGHAPYYVLGLALNSMTAYMVRVCSGELP
jgi:hypothetical protein